MNRYARPKQQGSPEEGCVGPIVMMAFAVMLAFGVHACDDSGPNDSDSYRVRAMIDEIHADSFHITDITILEASETTRERLEDGEDVHDNYKDVGCTGHETSDDYDELRESGQLHEGSIVEVSATVGKSHYSCSPGKSGLSGPRSLLEELVLVPQ